MVVNLHVAAIMRRDFFDPRSAIIDGSPKGMGFYPVYVVISGPRIEAAKKAGIMPVPIDKSRAKAAWAMRHQGLTYVATDVHNQPVQQYESFCRLRCDIQVGDTGSAKLQQRLGL